MDPLSQIKDQAKESNGNLTRWNQDTIPEAVDLVWGKSVTTILSFFVIIVGIGRVEPVG